MYTDNFSAERANVSSPAKTKVTTLQQVPKNLIVILLLEVIAVYGLLFFISPTSSTTTAAQVADIETVTSDAILYLTNQTRNTHGVNSLAINTELAEAAQAKAQYIIDNNYFAHENMNGDSFSSWVQQTDYDYVRVGENLAINFEDPNAIMNAWLESPTHRRNVLNPLFTDIGLAVLSGTYHNKETIVVVQLFGSAQ